MSTTNSTINEVSKRVLALSDSYATNKDFLEKCGIDNHSLITDLKTGRIKAPGAQYLSKIVRGTGCSGTWLLIGEGPMYDTRENSNLMVAENGVRYISKALHVLRLMKDLELRKADLKGLKLTADHALQSTKLTTLLLEHLQDNESDSD